MPPGSLLPCRRRLLSDRRNILGVYDQRRSKVSARALRAAPVDTLTGELIDEVITIPLDARRAQYGGNKQITLHREALWLAGEHRHRPSRAGEVKTDAESVGEDDRRDAGFHGPAHR